MNEAEKVLIQEALKLLDDAVAQLDSIENNRTAHVIAKVVHSAITLGEMLL